MRVIKMALVTGLLGFGLIWLATNYRERNPIKYDTPEPSAVQGLGANWDLGNQAERHKEVTAEAQRLNAAGDPDGALRVMKSRVVELNAEITRVEASTFYSVADKQKMLRALEGERALWSQAFAYQ